jgi:hypothetical protein
MHRTASICRLASVLADLQRDLSRRCGTQRHKIELEGHECIVAKKGRTSATAPLGKRHRMELRRSFHVHVDVVIRSDRDGSAYRSERDAPATAHLDG